VTSERWIAHRAQEWGSKFAQPFIGLGSIGPSKQQCMEGANTQWPDRPVSPLCISKQRELALISENLKKSYIIEIRLVSSFRQTCRKKTRGGKNEGIFHYVIENTCSKNARNWALHYVIENKCSYMQLSIMLMKRKGVVRRDKPAESRG